MTALTDKLVRVVLDIQNGFIVEEREMTLGEADALLEIFKEDFPRSRVEIRSVTPKSEPMTPAQRNREVDLLRRRKLDEEQEAQYRREQEAKEAHRNGQFRREDHTPGSVTLKMTNEEARAVAEIMRKNPRMKGLVLKDRIHRETGLDWLERNPISSFRRGRNHIPESGFEPRDWREDGMGWDLWEPRYMNMDLDGTPNARARAIMDLCGKARAGGKKAYHAFLDAGPLQDGVPGPLPSDMPVRF